MTQSRSSDAARAGSLPTVAVAISVLLWSTAYVLSAVVLVTASPAVLSELRLALAVPLMWALLLVRRRSAWRALRELWAALRRPATAVLGLTGVALFYLPSNLGLSISSPGTAALMSASLPLLTAVFAWAVIRERLTARVALGLVLTTVGIVIACAGASEPGLGAVLLVAGLVSYALYTVLLRRLGPATVSTRGSAPTDALTLATATAIWGAALLLPWVGVEVAAGTARLPAEAGGWLSLLFLALVVTAPTMALYNYGAERVPAAVSGAAAAMVPVLGYVLALLLGEPLVPLRAAGAALAFGGVVLAALPSRAPAVADAEPTTPAAGSRHTYEGARR